MKKSVYTIATTFALAAASPVFAQQGAELRINPPADPLYFGLKAGAMDVDDTEDAANNVGVVAGYKLHEDERGAFFAEGEYTRTFSDGDVDVTAGGSGDYDVETLSAYAGFRSAGQIFWKAKAGVSWWDYAVDGAPTRGPSEDDDISLSFGAGAGWRLNEKTGLEAEYTFIDSDINFLSIGIFTTF